MRRVALALATAVGLSACGHAGALPVPYAPGAPEAGAKATPIEHVVILIQENRSFDNLFATFPGADGTAAGKVAAMSPDEQSYCRSNGMPAFAKPGMVELRKTDLIGSGFGKSGKFLEDTDLDHIHTGFEAERDGGKMDGFDVLGSNADGSGPPVCTYPYQYVDPAQIAPYWDIAKEYVLADHTFQTQGSGSFTAHQDLIAGGTQINSDEALIDNPTYFPWGCDGNQSERTAVIKRNGKVYPYAGPRPCLPASGGTYTTLRDLLDAKGVSWKFYAMPVQKVTGCAHGDTPGIWSAFDAIKAVRYGPEWQTNVTRRSAAIFTDVSNRRLPAVARITPDALNSDHPSEYKHPPCGTGGPPADTGPSWVAQVVNAIGQSPYWDSTAIVVLWDDWGGFYDHVPPPPRQGWQGGPGFRIPLMVVSPYVKPHVDHTVYEFGSILRFVEETFGLGSLGKNDAESASIGNAFDFHMSPRKFATIPSKYSRAYFLHQQPSGMAPDTE